MRRLRPNQPVITLETWLEKNFHPGIETFLSEELSLSEQEMAEEFRIWQEYNDTRNPPFYQGMPELMAEFVDKGGILAVVSHSTVHHISRHYRLGAGGVEPRFIFGWDHNPERRKPSPWPLHRIMEETSIPAHQILVVDDLKPGVEMARAAGTAIAAAGWGHQIPSIQKEMKRICDVWLPDVESLRLRLFE